jgi:pentatricopeptide repeat protein
MEREEIELNDEGKCSVALGLLRDGQYEMALDYWDKMRDTATQVPEWVSAIFICVLMMRGFVDEAVQLAQQMLAMAGGSSKALSLVLWSYLLDECSRSLHYEGTKLVWDEMVSPGAINPADGIALNVLSTAARHGDAALATAVVEHLSKRDTKLGYQHYEPLLDAYVRDGRLAAAFRVLCIMNDAGVRPGRSSTRSIFAALKEAPELADEAIKTLADLQRVPVAAINVLLEGVAAQGDVTRTLDVYRHVRDLCQSGPSERTFALLLEGCDTAEPAVFLVAEMDRYSMRPTPAILDNLIRCFARDGSLDVALLYVDEMRRIAQSDTLMSERTLRAVAQRCYRDKNPKFLSLAAEAKRRGISLDWEALGVVNGAGSEA